MPSVDISENCEAVIIILPADEDDFPTIKTLAFSEGDMVDPILVMEAIQAISVYQVELIESLMHGDVGRADSVMSLDESDIKGGSSGDN